MCPMNMQDFPNAPHGWSVKDTEKKAIELGLELTNDHWSVVQALQEYFSKNDSINRRELTDALEEKFHNKGGLKKLYKLLPGGPVAQGCVIAGIQAPAGSIDHSFGSVV
ncbi:MAG TPA: TusE/DsrC/DsvC family sulfur relay protein [Thiothrix sp.]|nr:TusE/DsrC/DsvC family sulfur relay protein [Thiothrix sp.]